MKSERSRVRSARTPKATGARPRYPDVLGKGSSPRVPDPPSSTPGPAQEPSPGSSGRSGAGCSGSTATPGWPSSRGGTGSRSRRRCRRPGGVAVRGGAALHPGGVAEPGARLSWPQRVAAGEARRAVGGHRSRDRRFGAQSRCVTARRSSLRRDPELREELVPRHKTPGPRRAARPGGAIEALRRRDEPFGPARSFVLRWPRSFARWPRC